MKLNEFGSFCLALQLPAGTHIPLSVVSLGFVSLLLSLAIG